MNCLFPFSSKQINLELNGNSKFKWQKSFLDRIIRNEKELSRIRRYIVNNPLKWDLKKNLPENLDI